MDVYRKFLVWIKRQYHQAPARLLVFGGLAIALSATVSVLMDALLPTEGFVWVLIKSVAMFALAVSFFTVAYMVSLFFHYSKMNQNTSDAETDWVPFRQRLSPTWRNRIAILVGAVMMLIVYANSVMSTTSDGRSLTTTLSAGLMGAGVLAIFAFIRQTKDESMRASMGVPDARDVRYNDRLKRYQEAREAAEAKKAAAKAKAKEKKRESRIRF